MNGLPPGSPSRYPPPSPKLRYLLIGKPKGRYVLINRQNDNRQTILVLNATVYRIYYEIYFSVRHAELKSTWTNMVFEGVHDTSRREWDRVHYDLTGSPQGLTGLS